MSEAAHLLHEYLPHMLEGAWITLELALGGLALSLLLGIAACLGRLSNSRLLRWPALFYTTVIRGIPDLVQLFLFYYGGQYAINYLTDAMGWAQIEIEPFSSGIIILGFIFGAYMAETFRGAILAIPPGQIEAARAYGIAPLTIFRRITWPQMMRHALPALGNNWLVLMKSTALVSIINLHDMVDIAGSAARGTHRPFLFYSLSAVIFLAFTSVSILLLNWLKRRYSVGFSERQA